MARLEPGVWTAIATGVDQGRVQRIVKRGAWLVGKSGAAPSNSQSAPVSEPYQAMVNDEFPAVQSTELSGITLYGRPVDNQPFDYLFSEKL